MFKFKRHDSQKENNQPVVSTAATDADLSEEQLDTVYGHPGAEHMAPKNLLREQKSDAIPLKGRRP